MIWDGGRDERGSSTGGGMHARRFKRAKITQNSRGARSGTLVVMLEADFGVGRFPEGDAKEATMYVVSLGFCDASLRFGPIVVSGFLAAFLKWGIEWSKV